MRYRIQNSKFKIQNLRLLSTLLVVLSVAGFFTVTAQTEDVVMPDNAPKVSGHVEPDSVGIGDQFVYSIEVEKDLVQSVYFPEFTGPGMEHYELIEDMPVDTLSREGRKLRIRKRYLLGVFQEGRHRVVPQVMYADKNIIDTLYGNDTLDLQVTTFEIDSTSHGLFDIKPQKTLPFKFGQISGYVMWTLVALAILALLIYALIRILAHYGKNLGDLFRPTPPLPPHVVAAAALEKLYLQRLCQQGKHKAYYSGLTDILRTYIDSRFGVGAMEMTSDEIIEAMRKVELPQKSAMDLSDILREADLVKFAKAMPDVEEYEAAYYAAWEFVEQTKPVEQTEDDDENVEKEVK